MNPREEIVKMLLEQVVTQMATENFEDIYQGMLKDYGIDGKKWLTCRIHRGEGQRNDEFNIPVGMFDQFVKEFFKESNVVGFLECLGRIRVDGDMNGNKKEDIAEVTFAFIEGTFQVFMNGVEDAGLMDEFKTHPALFPIK